MDRRTFVRTTAAVTALGLAGCLTDGDNGDPADSEAAANGTSDDEEELDHAEYPEDAEDGEIVGTDENGHELLAMNDVVVPLAPTEDAYEWYQNDAVVIADARPEEYYQRRHVEGAVWSPAVEGQESDDPLEALSTDQRILTYCRCPHHLSSLRASALIGAGYETVYALDKGLDDWVEKGYPVVGEIVE